MYPNPIALAGGHNAGHFEPGMPLISPSKKKRRHRKSGRQGGMGETPEHEQQQKQQKPIPKGQNRAPLDASHPPDTLLDRLQARSVYPLKNKSVQCPKALYFCRLCSYHCDNVDRAEQHIRGNRHIMKENNRDMREFLLFIPTPLRSHLQHLSKACLPAEASACALPQAELNRRLAMFEEVKQFLEKVPGLSPDLRLQVFGSTVNGFAMHESDVNIDVVDARDRRQLLGRFLLQSYQAMQDFNKATKRFVVVEDNFMGAYPYFLAKDAENVEYKFSVNNSHCLETNVLLKVYCDMDERCKQLGYLFRKLGKLSHMDKQDVGTFPPLAFPLMAIHFLQQIQPPVLPVLHHLAKDNAAIPHSSLTKVTVDDTELVYVHEPTKYWNSKNDMSIGELWLKMLRYYAVDFNYESQVISITSPYIVKKIAKLWKHKRVSIEDPMFPKRDLGRSLGLNDVMDYVLLQLRTAYRYFAVPQTEEGPLFRYVKRLAVDVNDSGTPATAKRRVNIVPLFNPNGELQRTASRLVVDLRIAGYMYLKNQPNFIEPRPYGLHATVLAVGNRILNLLGITNTAAIGLMLPEYPTPPTLTDEIVDEECKRAVREFLELIVNTYFRAGNWNMKVKILRRQLRAALVRCLDRCKEACEVDTPKADDSIEAVARSLVQQIINEAMDSLSAEGQGSDNGKGVSESSSEPRNGKLETTGSAEQGDDSALSEDDDSDDDDEKTSGETGPINGLPKLPLGVVSCDEPGYLSLALYRNLSPEKLHYDFSSTGMVGDIKPPELRCSSCNRCGHLRDSCPEDEVDFRTVKLPNLSAADSHLMTTLLQQVPNDFLETDEHRQARSSLLADIKQTLKKTPYQTGQLEMFGSCVNGFGFHTSDVDVCMSFYDSLDNPKEFSDKEVRDIVVDIAKIMKRCKKFYPCRAIPQAKVPIVKFTHWPTKQEGDLSLNNRLALQNSKLLLTYHNMDSRVKTLGFIIKILAKLCGIGDASRGSLSSYAYIILMLHYLQQENVIPCLQEMYPRDKPKPVLTIEGWDAWFNDDLQYVYAHWKPRNNKTVSELWLGFLMYYTQVFNWRQTVVTIKQMKPLHRLEKLWTQAHLAIEDPFDLNHNLGCGLSKKMATYIQRVLFKTLLHFRNPLPNLPPAQIKDFLFDPKKLTGPLGPVPRDRCCKTCGVIGHIARECPTTSRGRADDGEFPGEIEGAEGEEAEEELEEEEEFGEDGEEISEESPTTPGKANAECQPSADVPDGEAMPGQETRQRGNSQSSSTGPSTPSGAVRSRASPQKPPPPPTTVQAQLMYPAASSVVGPPPPPIVYIPNSPGNSSSPYQLSMRPIMMTVDNRDVAVPVATAPSADILMNMFCNVWNAGPGPAGTGLPRLELDPNQQDPCILGVGPVASGPGTPNALPVTQANPNVWPRLPQPASQSLASSHHHHPTPATPFQVQQAQTGSHSLPGPSHNTFQQQRPTNQDHQQQHRGGFHGAVPPVGNRSQRSPHPQLSQQAQSQGQQPPYSRIARDFGPYPGQLDSPSHSHMHPGHQNPNMYNRPPPGTMLGQHGNQFGVHHRHGYQQYQHHPQQQQSMNMPVPPVQQRRPAALQQPHQQQFGHPNGHTTSPGSFKGGPKRRG